MLLILLGKTASGKTAVANKLCRDYGFKPIITYTTRPMRDGEENGVNYHYISEDDFKQKIDSGFFAEWCSYDTVYGKWYYGSALDDYRAEDDNRVIVLNPKGFEAVKELNLDNVFSCLMFVDDDDAMFWYMQRGGDIEEFNRRRAADNIDFNGVDDKVDCVVKNGRKYYLSEIICDILSRAYFRGVFNGELPN